MDVKKKFRLVDWNLVCQPKKNGGLGIRPIKLMNKVLLGEWLWRLGEENNSLWRQIVLAKYKVDGEVIRSSSMVSNL